MAFILCHYFSALFLSLFRHFLVWPLRSCLVLRGNVTAHRGRVLVCVINRIARHLVHRCECFVQHVVMKLRNVIDTSIPFTQCVSALLDTHTRERVRDDYSATLMCCTSIITTS